MMRIGVVGTGFMGQTHVDRYKDLSNAEVTAVASLEDPRKFIEENGLNATAYDDGFKLISDADVDAVDVCTPTPSHPDLTIAVLEEEIDVFCEKPVANSLKSAQRIADADEVSSATCMVGHTLRYFPEYASMREQVVEENAIGEPGVARARRISPFPKWGRDSWYEDKQKSGGLLLDLAIHDLDFLRWTMGEINRVFARQSSWNGGQHAHVTLRFETGAVGYVEASWALPDNEGLSTELDLAGEDGLIEYENSGTPSIEFRTRAEPSVSLSTVEKDGYHRELEAFVDCIQNGEKPPVGIDEGIEAIRISLAAIESAERGEPVSLSEVSA